MQVLTARVDLRRFLDDVAKAPARVLMLDYDGTLAPFNVRPDLAVPYPHVSAMLADIVRAGGTRVVIVSGRPAAELPPLLALEQPPEIWGSHGWERLLPDGTHQTEKPADEARSALRDAAAALRAAMPDGRLEEKLASIALHWRGLDDLAASVLERTARVTWQPFADMKTLELLPFDCGLELRAVGCNKQYAVKAVLSETRDDSAVAYLGDDITDEDAFRAIKPRGIGVLVRGEFRPTEADVWLKPPDELVEFMRRWCVSGGEPKAWSGAD